ncbi:MAG TPA: hypothetical protein VF789_09185 [Thermoanaerobaculia bacterium]
MAPHVQAAVAQAKVAPAAAPRGVAPHAQAARVPPPRPPAAPLPPPPPPVRTPQAAHVQRALATVQPKASQPVRPNRSAPRLQPAPDVRNVPAPPVRHRPAQARPLTVQLAKRKFEVGSDEEDELDLTKKQKTTQSFDNSSLFYPVTSYPVYFPPFNFTSSFLSVPNFNFPPFSIFTPPQTLPSFTSSLFSGSFSNFNPSPLLDPPTISLDLSSTKLDSPVTSISDIVSVYDPSTAELSDLAKSAQDLFAYEGSDSYVNQRIVKLYDVKGVTFNKRSTGTVHAALQINHMTPMISSSGEYGTPTKVVRTWMEGLTWKNEKGKTLKGFTSPSTGDSSITFTIPRKISKKTNLPGHRWSAHAEVNAYRELYRLYTEDQGTASSIVKFRMATNIAHCAECWWAAHALFKKLGIDVGKLETSSPTENVLFKQWTEPWEGFFQDLGMDSSPFRDKKGTLKDGFKKNKKAIPLELNKLQKDVTFL